MTQIAAPVMDYLDVDTIISITGGRPARTDAERNAIELARDSSQSWKTSSRLSRAGKLRISAVERDRDTRGFRRIKSERPGDGGCWWNFTGIRSARSRSEAKRNEAKRGTRIFGRDQARWLISISPPQGFEQKRRSLVFAESADSWGPKNNHDFPGYRSVTPKSRKFSPLTCRFCGRGTPLDPRATETLRPHKRTPTPNFFPLGFFISSSPRPR